MEKFHDADPKGANSPSELKNTCFMGTSVQGNSDGGRRRYGSHTYLGTMAGAVTRRVPRLVSTRALVVSPGS